MVILLNEIPTLGQPDVSGETVLPIIVAIDR